MDTVNTDWAGQKTELAAHKKRFQKTLRTEIGEVK
ncbi:hypothetical protein QFZ57_003207 [Arthrobacter sp. B1I2]|nr:hypothetical protein [Arthrobacter sp. B1I2]